MSELPPRMGVKGGGGGAKAWGSSTGMFGEYGLHLCFIKSICGRHISNAETHPNTHAHTHKHMHVFQVLIRRVPETPPCNIHTSEAFHSHCNIPDPPVSILILTVHITVLPTAGCLFRDVPLGAEEVTGDFQRRKRE